MRLPRVRFTVRRLMVVVLVVGIASGWLVESERRRQQFLHLSRRYAQGEYEVSAKAVILIRDYAMSRPLRSSRAEIASGLGLDAEEQRLFLSADRDDVRVVLKNAGLNRAAVESRIDPDRTIEEGGLGRLLRWEEYHRGMRRKYQKDAKYPWLPVAPDPPKPE